MKEFVEEGILFIA